MFFEFIKIAYCLLAPLLLLVTILVRGRVQGYTYNLIATLNLLLIAHSIFLVRQLHGIYKLAQAFGMHYGSFFKDNYGLVLRLVLISALPLLSLLRVIRVDRWYSLAMLVLLYWVFPPASWNLFQLPVKIAAFGCLGCAAYALFWLLNQLPYQSPPR